MVAAMGWDGYGYGCGSFSFPLSFRFRFYFSRVGDGLGISMEYGIRDTARRRAVQTHITWEALDGIREDGEFTHMMRYHSPLQRTGESGTLI